MSKRLRIVFCLVMVMSFVNLSASPAWAWVAIKAHNITANPVLWSTNIWSLGGSGVFSLNYTVGYIGRIDNTISATNIFMGGARSPWVLMCR